MDGTILGQGTFTATGAQQIIMIPSGSDFLNIYNFTEAAAGVGDGNGFRFYWQLGMGSQGIVDINTSGTVTCNLTAAGAFTLYNPGNVVPGPAVALTAVSTAAPSVVTTASTAGLTPGAVVVLNNLNNQPQFSGIPFTIGYGTFNSTHFSLDYVKGTGTTASTSGTWTLLSYGPLFYPHNYVIMNVSAASSAVITLSVQHALSVGQQIRLSFPGGTALWGSYANLDGLQGTITAVDTATGYTHNSITVNVNTTGFGTFAFPNITAAFTPAQVIPFGDYTAVALAQTPPLSSLEDSTQNTAFLGMILAAGALLPAGIESDVIYWVAGKSTYGGQ